ncbi:MAG: hypothetical protein COZ34_02500 [Candidatus Pacebacteria bacterium CG_4_10_14_3_um_filter_34_15]|nr:DUF3048 domain-containing protein [Candidatus Pacearchaeota archaeon]NCQ65618.1 DUF3048 domain-containing protein [Candidatus Paceibacterota bacterium]PIQ80542.1 MAG: hypothetical protein COV78_05095 [Candidatus Pacebacteria bacterium CG11_big_fil_rev_8_21_14_0_20_34_55]PIX81588.1 MAG: hypothetical protein COZ34_02500 [Candidatus Pacebacteria bacterium CG_4_10_14_3_um_filter_34_15]PJC44177.1 MAG: hypothetical protein CO039_00245 [Candidatus Pacebacteria bacterium CG_4_9_14_0_2_um_filter_34_5
MKFTSKKILIMTLMIYVLSSVLSYSTFSYFLGSSDGNKMTDNAVLNEDGTPANKVDTLLTALLEIDPSEAKTEACPLNGKLFTKQEKDAWEMKRPLAIMIENSVDARPQSGLGDADIVFEAMAEGGVTRFMGLFYCGVQRYNTIIAPVRSARTYFVEYASGFNYPLYVHVGGANIPGPANALGQIADYGWSLENDLNQFSIGFPTFVRNNDRLDREVATEHTMQATTEDLWRVAAKRDWTNIAPKRKYGRTTIGGDDWKDTYKSWSFQDEAGVIGATTNIKYEFWNGFSDFGVEWQYDKDSNSYNRLMAGAPHIDLNIEEQIKASNVIVLLTAEKGPIDELRHMLYTTIGKGNALIFKNGDAIKATWSKATRESELKFFDRKGDEIEFARGLTWISVVDLSTKVTY